MKNYEWKGSKAHAGCATTDAHQRSPHPQSLSWSEQLLEPQTYGKFIGPVVWAPLWDPVEMVFLTSYKHFEVTPVCPALLSSNIYVT